MTQYLIMYIQHLVLLKDQPACLSVSHYNYKAFNGVNVSGMGGWISGGFYSSGTYTGNNAGYAGEWVQIDIGTTVVLDNLKIWKEILIIDLQSL